MAKVLVIDDEKSIGTLMSRIIERMGHTVEYAETIKTGMEAVHLDNFDIIFLDVQLPDGNGLNQLPVLKELPSAPEVIVITGFANSEGAQQALSSNAWDYIQKPVSVGAITRCVQRALQYREERNICRPRHSLKRAGIIGSNHKIKACLNTVERAAGSRANILINGETGTGKELFARAIHDNSPRAEKNFVVIDCGALPDSLVESLLLGHVKGAFTGADKAAEGLIKHADGGTLFLDEVGELSFGMQKVFLRVLEERCFCPIGDTRETKSDFRLVAASNRNLAEMVKKGQFRDDLLFRLGSISIDIPPLRQRVDDIKELAMHHLTVLCDSHNIEPKDFSPEFLDVLQAYRWPGNVRELFSVLDATLANVLHESTFFAKHLPQNVRIEVARSRFDREMTDKEPPTKAFDSPDVLPDWQKFRRAHIEDGEKKYLKALISLCRGNVLKAAQYSGLSRPHLYGLLRKYGLST
ncbi:MAG: sigma-54-dependent Fis family transcriptional regulator [Proteobacteria bacterium]|nr:sigma-54-dependent Fis family transcriptional regulator [Pseudomonadota bacterium]